MPEIATLSDPNGRLRIDYSREALQRIRELAIDGLMSLPRIGMGVGGLLLGSRHGGVVRLLNSIEIPCSHSGGPSFNLTEAEKKHVSELIAGLGGAGVVGWYCSKTRGAPALGDAEMALFRELCPGSDQIALVVKPSTVVPVRAAFFFRDAKGQTVQAIEWDLEEWRDESTDGVEADTTAAPPVATMAAAVAAEPPLPPPLPEVPPAPEPRRTVPPPVFASVAPRKSKVSGWILALAACLALAAAAFLTQDTWRPRPPLTLTSAESDGKLTIRWNADAFGANDYASLSINDGGNLESVPLDRVQLNQGMYIYSPKSERVTAKLSSSDLSAITVWFAPEPKQSPVPVPAPAPAAEEAKDTPKPAAHVPVPDDR